MWPVSGFVFRPAVMAVVAAAVIAAVPIQVQANPPIPVAVFDFEAAGGGPDAQGWRPLSLFASETTHFHIEDFAGAGHEAAALAGQRSMWCGATAEDPQTCHWNSAPGYGSNWNDNLISQPFTVTGDVTLGFLMETSTEAGYDYVYLEFEDLNGFWIPLDIYNCGFLAPCGPIAKSYTLPAAAHDGSLRFRFNFRSDGAIDNEFPYGGVSHIAFVVDSLTVSDAGGVVDYQDFESEAVGDTVTADGHWYGEPNRDAHSGGLLVDGTATLQETSPVNGTWFWGFYADSDRDYGCTGHPEQLVVPETRSLIRSPMIDLTRDIAGNPLVGAVDSVRLSFDVYRDISPTGQKHYLWHIRGYIDGCLASFDRPPVVFRGNQKDWFRQEVVLVPPVGTTEIVVELVVENFFFEESHCRSHAPLFDNIAIERFGGGVSAVTGPAVAGRLVLLPNAPNPFNPVTTIRFELPQSGRVSLRIYDVAGRLVRTLLEGAPMPAGPGTAVWRGMDDGGKSVASGTYFCRLTAGSRSTIRSMTLLR